MKSLFSHPPSFLAQGLAAAACGFACMVLPATHAFAAAGGDTLTVAMRYVQPPFIGGAKVRTPEAMDTDLAQALADRLHAALHAVALEEAAAASMESPPASTMRQQPPPTGQAQSGLSALAPKADVVLMALPNGYAPPASTVAVATGYVARPMAIMRTDTDIKSWRQLKGRTVCLSQGGLYVGAMAAQYGAVEKIFKAPADSLLALRTGGCDAAVHDDRLLKELITLPEWKKFSASLPPGPEAPLAFIVSADNSGAIAALEALGKEWRSGRYLAKLNQKRVHDIAFEVYLDQVIPDCH